MAFQERVKKLFAKEQGEKIRSFRGPPGVGLWGGLTFSHWIHLNGRGGNKKRRSLGGRGLEHVRKSFSRRGRRKRLEN